MRAPASYTGLEVYCPQTSTDQFLGWRTGQSLHMAYSYPQKLHFRIVGLSKTSRALVYCSFNGYYIQNLCLKNLKLWEADTLLWTINHLQINGMKLEINGIKE
jgi:hypothetical protein